MRDKRTNRAFGFLLAAILIFQLAHNAVHVFTSHASDSHIEYSGNTIQIDEVNYSCDFCGKLLGKATYLLFYPFLFLSFVIFALAFNTKRIFYISKAKKENPLRGPPYHF